MRIETDSHRFDVINQGVSSDKLGNCEVCGKAASEIFSQYFYLKLENGWAHCGGVFGHEKCLESFRINDGKTHTLHETCPKCENPYQFDVIHGITCKCRKGL